jgi:DNA-binding transcriptional ArsR family regulator
MTLLADGPDVDEVLRALADPTRRRLLDQLAQRGYATATTLCGELAITRQAVVQHLTLLGSAGLVRGQKSGRERRYEVSTQRLSETARWLDDVASQWDARLSAIKRIAERSSDPQQHTGMD